MLIGCSAKSLEEMDHLDQRCKVKDYMNPHLFDLSSCFYTLLHHGFISVKMGSFSTSTVPKC